ncbi:unnamed protein product [Effrenium voratum]|nr:unnamed protein product [Effrenium voratum]
MLQALVELQQLFDISRSSQLPRLRVAMQWLAQTREELCVWGQRAGRAVQALAGSSRQPQVQELGYQLHSLLQGSITEALKQTSSHFDQELAQMREELRQTRGHAAAAAQAQKQEAIAAKQGMQWGRSLEQLLEKKFKDNKATEERCWQSLREDEVVRSRDQVMSEMSEQHVQSVKELSELWAAQNVTRDRQLQLLREHAETAMVEMKSSLGSAEMATMKAESEKQALAAAESRFAENLQAERVSHDKALAHEQREKGALVLQLTEAMDAVSKRDRSIEELRRSLGDAEKARPEPVQTAMSFAHRAGPLPSSPKATSGDEEGPPAKRQERPSERGQMLPSSFDDSAGSVCRLSTESTAFGRPKSLPADSVQPRRRTVLDKSLERAEKGEGGGPLPRRRPAKSCPRCGKLLEIDARECNHCGHEVVETQPAPWELPPQEFLLMWRQSQVAAMGTQRARMRDAPCSASTDRDKPGALSPSPSTDTLRITASWD